MIEVEGTVVANAQAPAGVEIVAAAPLLGGRWPGRALSSTEPAM